MKALELRDEAGRLRTALAFFDACAREIAVASGDVALKRVRAVLHGGGPLKESFLDESCGHDVACTLPQAGLRQTSRRPHEIQRRRMNVFSPGTAFGATPRR